MNGIIVSLNSLKKRENPSEIEKNLTKIGCCVTPCIQTDVGSSQKFRVLLNVGIDPNFPQKCFFSSLTLFREKVRFPAKTFLALQAFTI